MPLKIIGGETLMMMVNLNRILPSGMVNQTMALSQQERR